MAMMNEGPFTKDKLKAILKNIDERKFDQTWKDKMPKPIVPSLEDMYDNECRMIKENEVNNNPYIKSETLELLFEMLNTSHELQIKIYKELTESTCEYAEKMVSKKIEEYNNKLKGLINE